MVALPRRTSIRLRFATEIIRILNHDRILPRLGDGRFDLGVLLRIKIIVDEQSDVICVVQCDQGIHRGAIFLSRDGNTHELVCVQLNGRFQGTEPLDLGFNVYRQIGSTVPLKLNGQPLTAGTNFIDRNAKLEEATAYFVRAIQAGREEEASKPFSLNPSSASRNYLSIPLQTPIDYVAGDASPADLDGDGEYEIIIHMTGRGRDNSQAGFTDEPILHAYKLNGTLLWVINL